MNIKEVASVVMLCIGVLSLFSGLHNIDLYTNMRIAYGNDKFIDTSISGKIQTGLEMYSSGVGMVFVSSVLFIISWILMCKVDK